MTTEYSLLHLLRSAEELKRQRRFRELASLLEPVSRDKLIDEPELGLDLSNAWRHTGKYWESLELLQQLAFPLSAMGNVRLSRRRTNIAAGLCFNVGRIEEAEHLWQQLLHQSTLAGDTLYVARAGINLGMVADLRGRYLEALGYYHRATLAGHSSGDQLGLVCSNVNLAITHRQLGDYHNAESHLNKAFVYARQMGAEQEIGMCEIEKSCLHCSMGDLELAEAEARSALARFEALGDPGGVGEAYCALGVIAAAAARWPAATADLGRALGHAREIGRKLLEAEVQEELSFVHRHRDDYRAALEAFEEALRLYLELGASGRVERLVRRAARVAVPTGEPLRRPLTAAGAPPVF